MEKSLSLKSCPRCGTQVEDLTPIDTGMKVALQATGEAQGLPPLVCPRCYDELTGKVSQGVRLRIEKENREKNKMMLWKQRVNLIKQARQLMTQKSYSEAAVSYEKYLRVLEVVYNLQKGELKPEVFNNSKRSKELTVVASVYWDLLRIYDTSPKYGARMSMAAQKLALFLPFSTIFPDIVKKADSFARSAKNPQIVRSFLKACKAGGGGCFVATAIFESATAAEVEVLRQFRDQRLQNFALGRSFIHAYYQHSPPLAAWVRKHPHARVVLRPVLKKIAALAKKSLKS